MAKNRDLDGVEEETIEAAHKMRTNHLLVIGIDDYQNGITDLNNAVLDAKTVAALLQKKYNFKPENTKILLNKEATREAIISAFDTKMDSLTEDDNFVFYFSGHGEIVKRGNRGFWIPADGKVGKRSSWVSNNDIKESLASTSAHHILGIVDSCFSGSFFRNLTRENTPNKTFQLLDSTPSRWLLTAGRETLVPDGAPGEHSPFARVLISHLKTNPLPALPISTLVQNVIFAPSINNVNAKPRGEALNISGSDGGQFIFYKKDFKPNTETIETPVSKPMRNIAPEKVEEKEAPLKPKGNIIDQIKELIAIDEMDNAMDLIAEKISPDARINKDLFLLKSRHFRMMKDKRRGTISDDNFSINHAKLTHALLSYVDDIKKEDIL